MKANFLKRLKAIENRAKAIASDAPQMILIHFDDHSKLWICAAMWPDYERHKASTKYSAAVERLQDYIFPADFSGNVILETFGSNDTDITENLFCFNIDSLRGKQKLPCFIKSIRHENGKSVSFEVVFVAEGE